MQIVLGGLAGEAQREFFDYFNAALRRIGGGVGSSGFNPDGSFEVSLACTLPVGRAHACLVWHWIRKPDGSVDALDVLPEHEGTPAGWEDAAREFVTGVLVTALQKKRTHFFNRTTYFYIGVNLDGEYWLPGTRIAPAIYDDAKPYLINCERAVYIDHKVTGIDATQAGEVGGERARRIAARASLLLNVGFYRTVPDLRFVLGAESAPTVVPGRLHIGFIDSLARPARMPEKGRECPLGRYLKRGVSEVRRPDEKLKFPAESRSIFRAADNPAHLFGEAFDRCARLYQIKSL